MRMVLTVTEEMRTAFNEAAAKRGATSSGLARKILSDWLAENEKPVEWIVRHGGYRNPKNKKSEDNGEV